jgi:hypothetical protein
MGSSMSALFQFLSGSLMMGFGIAALFFFRSWQKTRDRIFMSFGVSFFILALERIVLLTQSNSNLAEDHPQVYLMRLTAFIILLWGIRGKNRHAS